VATYPFLSDDWIDEARRIHEEHRAQAAPAAGAVRLNLVVEEVPFGNGSVDAHLDTTSGEMVLDMGHVDAADALITLGYDTAKSVLVGEEGPQAAMQAFMGGRVKVQGDMAKILVLQQHLSDPAAQEVGARIREITE
jgi:putative sterol carrier protein